VRGRKPQAIEERIKQGNTQRRPLPEPVLIGGRPIEEEFAEPPEDLPEDGKDLWRTEIQRLVEVGAIDRVDRPALELLCITYAHARQAQRVVAKVGHFSFGSRGQPKEHPALKIYREESAAFYRMAESWGLTPLARARLGLADVHRRSLEVEMNSALGKPKFVKAEDEDEDEADAVVDADVVE
jgi:P27 family predicted phage terminase small subunit